MYTLITFATQWGSRYGGINSFNADFLTAFGLAYHLEAQVICIVASATPEAIEEASKAHVRLVPLPFPPETTSFDSSHGQAGVDVLKSSSISYDLPKTVWLGHDRITGAAAVAAAKLSGGHSAVIHHMSYDHYESYAESSQTAYNKVQAQAAIFREADIVLAVGPLLRDAAIDLIRGLKDVHMLIPGLAEIEPRKAPNTFVAFMSGRLTEDASRIKQGHLGVAAVAQAQRDGRDEGRPEALRRPPKLLLRGVDFENALANFPLPKQRGTEGELRRFAEEYADGVVNLHALPFTEDRRTLYDELSVASVALMPSWHEGFGLVGWEAIAAGVPLIVSKNSGLYRLLEEEHPGQGTGCVYSLVIRGKEDEPFFRDEDLESTVETLKQIADNPSNARKQANILKNILEDYTWPACAGMAADAFGWALKKGSMSSFTPEIILQIPETIVVPATVSERERGPLQLPVKQWRADAGMAASQLLRAEEALLPFDSARKPDVDELNSWLDDNTWQLSVRLVTGPAGQGKTRLALELCRQRIQSDWYAGFLDSDVESNRLPAIWQALRKLNQPLLIVIDYAETRQTAFLALLNAALQTQAELPIRMLLLARDAGEWWDNLPSRDRLCEPLLSGSATSGPFRLPALYVAETDRREAYKRALHAFGQTLGVSAPDIYPDLIGEHFERPLYVQIAALLAFYGESQTTAQGLTKALLNHERRYWEGLLAPYGWVEPGRRAEQLLALTTIAGGFDTPRAATPYWEKAKGNVLSLAEFSLLFRALATLYPGTQGLQALRPDLLGEALVAQAVLRPGAATLLDAVLSNTATQNVRRNALTVLARLLPRYPDVDEMLVEALIRHFRHCCQDIAAVGTETTSHLPVLAEEAFTRLSPADKSQVAGLLAPSLYQVSLQLNGLNCMISEYLVEKLRENYKKKPNNVERMVEYANALDVFAVNLARMGRYQQAIDVGFIESKLYRQLAVKDPGRFEINYAVSLTNYANHLSDFGQCEEAFEYSRRSLVIYQRWGQKNTSNLDSNYGATIYTYAKLAADMDRYEDALEYSRQSIEFYQPLVQKSPEKFERNYAASLTSYSINLARAGRYEEALKHSRQSINIHQRLAQKNPDRFQSDYAASLSNHANRLSEVDQYEEALQCSRHCVEIYQKLAQMNPDRFERGFGSSLISLAVYLHIISGYKEALEYSQQSIEILQKDIKKNADRVKPDYATSLANHGGYLSDAGQYEEAFEYTRQAQEIYERLAQKRITGYAEQLVMNTCSLRFHAWLCGKNEGGYQLDLDEMMAHILPSRRPLTSLMLAFADACLTTDQVSRAHAFHQVFSKWYDLSAGSKSLGKAYWLCSAAWLASFGQADLGVSHWESSFRQYSNQLNGCVPRWMLEVARRLEFQWPH